MRAVMKNNSCSGKITSRPVARRSARAHRFYSIEASMDVAKGIDLTIRWCRFNLRMVGLWPDHTKEDKGFFDKYYFLIPSGTIVFFTLFPQLMNLRFVWGDIDLVTENLSTASMPWIGCVSQFISLRYYKKGLRKLMAAVTDDWHREKTSKEWSVMMKYGVLAHRLSIFGMLLMFAMITLYVVMRLMVLIVSDRYSVSQDRLPIYQSYFPFDITKSPILEIIWIGQIMAAYSAAYCYSGIDSCICSLILHICGQFINLRDALVTVFDNVGSAKYSAEDEARLRDIVKRHQYLCWFAMTLEECLNANLLVHVLVSTTQLCFQALQVYQFVTTKGEGSVIVRMLFFISFVGFYTLHIYMYCYLGEMLIVQSTKIGNSAYQSKWFGVPKKGARYILLIINRSMSPLYLTAGKFSTFSLQTFSGILKTSFGYLSVLLTVMNATD